jgi:alpha-beta hydrolase superfamily lysophospholipase
MAIFERARRLRVSTGLLIAAGIGCLAARAMSPVISVHGQSPPKAASCAVNPSAGGDWKNDCELGPGFVYKTLPFPDDYDGKVTATVVRNEPLVPNARGAVLFIHGFLDYVFHRHVAERLMAAGYNFYGLDLRKYGRSLDGAAHPNFCHSMQEYFAEIREAIRIIRTQDSNLILYAHSTGALPATLYAKDADPQGHITRIVLNSPFLDFTQWSITTNLAVLFSRPFPFMEWKNPVSSWYARSLHKEYKGEWLFNRDWKRIDGAVAHLGWVRCVSDAQKRIRKRLDLRQPILVMHSDTSSRHSSKWRPEYAHTDLILDVSDIEDLSGRLGRNVTRAVIPGAVHDVVLSRKPARERAMTVMLDWLN